jgi:hypothetical protein
LPHDPVPSTPTALTGPNVSTHPRSWRYPLAVASNVAVSSTVPRWSVTAATWKSRWVSTPTVTAPGVCVTVSIAVPPID